MILRTVALRGNFIVRCKLIWYVLNSLGVGWWGTDCVEIVYDAGWTGDGSDNKALWQLGAC